MELEITPDIIIRHGDPIAISYANANTFGLYKNHTRNSIRFYDLMVYPWAPRKLDGNNSLWAHHYYCDVRDKKSPPREGYIHGENIFKRVLPVSLEMYKGTVLYQEYELIKRIINEH